MPPSDLELDFSEPAPPPQPVETRDIYTPSRLNREARTLLERGLPALWLEGEISNLSRPSSGHWYFSLKDEAAQLRCAMFRQRNLMARFSPRDGSHVLVRGRVSLYEQRGDYQFIADYMEEAGEGALRQRFELLKAKLAAEGLFAIEHKRPLPRLPRRIGVITSPTGAAIRDVLHILRRRFCTIPVLDLPRPGARRRRCGTDREDDPARVGARGMRRADSGARRRLARGSVGVQRRERRARDLRLRRSDRHRHRSRSRFHDRGFRRRRARADAVGRSGAGRSGLQRVAEKCPAPDQPTDGRADALAQDPAGSRGVAAAAARPAASWRRAAPARAAPRRSRAAADPHRSFGYR